MSPPLTDQLLGGFNPDFDVITHPDRILLARVLPPKDSGRTPVQTLEKILALLERPRPTMPLAQVAQALGKSARAVERATIRLTKSGLLKRVGPDKGGH